LKAKGPADICK